MAGRNARIGTRTGRFKADAAGNLLIIRGGADSVRVYNSGENAYVIKPQGTSTPSSAEITLVGKSSVDSGFNTEVIIVISAVPVEGIYEVIDPLNPIPPGRFKNTSDSGTTLTIVQDRNNQIYRILNSGKHTFRVLVDGTERGKVRPRHSLDVGAGFGTGQHRITITATTRFHGIYDYLDRRNLIRSGRFKIKQGTDDLGDPINPTTPHPIVNLVNTNQNNVSPWYRIFNSGEHRIVVRNGTATAHNLEPDRSFDLQVLGTNREITVESEQNDRPIEGSYDFIR